MNELREKSKTVPVSLIFLLLKNISISDVSKAVAIFSCVMPPERFEGNFDGADEVSVSLESR